MSYLINKLLFALYPTFEKLFPKAYLILGILLFHKLNIAWVGISPVVAWNSPPVVLKNTGE